MYRLHWLAAAGLLGACARTSDPAGVANSAASNVDSGGAAGESSVDPANATSTKGASTGGSSATSTGGAGSLTDGDNGGSSNGDGGESGDGAVADNPNSCDTPYVGPVGGPRVGGPAAIHTDCRQIEADVILARYKDAEQKVPERLYFEPEGVRSIWEQPCSDSIDETLERAREDFGDTEAQLSSDWSYEVSVCDDADQRRIYSNARCDSLTATTLADFDADNLAFLASLLWWTDNGNVRGSQIVGYLVGYGETNASVGLCTIRTIFGNSGECDAIIYESTRYDVVFGERLTAGEPSALRTITGDCN